MPEIFTGVTLLVTHYNRSNSLENLLHSFQNLGCVFEDIVVSDDGSNTAHQEYLKKIQSKFKFRLITTSQNKGLGNNLNKGQDAVVTPYTLYVQEDFTPTLIFPAHFKDALGFMNEEKELDVVRFYAYKTYPYLKAFKNGFSKMLIKPWYINYGKVNYYSDHPHLRRSNYFTKFGRYAEGIKGDRTEYRMCISFIQNKGNGLFFNNFKELFIQENSAAEPSTMTRKNLTTSKNIFITFIRNGYRQLRYNYDIQFAKY